MIDTTKETLLTMQEAADRCRVSLPTVYRWASSQGLETVKIGGARRTTLEAIQRFSVSDQKPTECTVAATSAYQLAMQRINQHG